MAANARAARWHALAQQDVQAWRGLAVAALVLLLAGVGVLLAWPELLAAAARWPLALAYALLSPLLHALLQRVAPPQALPLPVRTTSADLFAELSANAAPREDEAAPAADELHEALYAAARGGRVDRALQLLQSGADPFAPSPAGDPPLALAVRLGWLRLQLQLLERGADREARDSHGMTALHLAAALGREASLKLLIQQGASPEARAADGQTPLGVALASGRRDLADWLDWRIWPLPRLPVRKTSSWSRRYGTLCGRLIKARCGFSHTALRRAMAPLAASLPG